MTRHLEGLFKYKQFSKEIKKHTPFLLLLSFVVTKESNKEKDLISRTHLKQHKIDKECLTLRAQDGSVDLISKSYFIWLKNKIKKPSLKINEGFFVNYS